MILSKHYASKACGRWDGAPSDYLGSKEDVRMPMKRNYKNLHEDNLIPSMYGMYIFTYIYHKNQPNVGEYTMDGMGIFRPSLTLAGIQFDLRGKGRFLAKLYGAI